MVLRSNLYEQHISARLLDFFGKSSTWPRRLWGVGVFLMLREILEGADAMTQKVLTEPAVQTIVDEAKRTVIKDPAVAQNRERAALLGTLKEDFVAGGFNCRRLEQQIAALEPHYLTRWAQIIADPDPPKPERVARAIATHLLDRGFSGPYLHRWWSFRVKHEPGTRTLSDILTQDVVATLMSATPTKHTVLVALAARPSVVLRCAPNVTGEAFRLQRS